MSAFSNLALSFRVTLAIMRDLILLWRLAQAETVRFDEETTRTLPRGWTTAVTDEGAVDVWRYRDEDEFGVRPK
jgi:hypothetical protein